MRPPAPITPTRRVSLAQRTRVDARAVSPPAMIKLRRLSWCCMASILAGRAKREKWRRFDFSRGGLLTRDTGAADSLAIPALVHRAFPNQPASGALHGVENWVYH